MNSLLLAVALISIIAAFFIWYRNREGGQNDIPHPDEPKYCYVIKHERDEE